MTSSSIFPLEIFEIILDFLAADDDQSFSSIKSCSLVSHYFLPRTRSHIFHSIILDGPPPRAPYLSPTTLEFKSLISQSPEIAHYVRALNFCIKQQSLAFEGFATALNSLTNLESLTVDSDILADRWKNSPFRETVLNLIHMPTLRRLKLINGSNMNLFISDLTLCANLKSLEIGGLWSTNIGRDIQVYQEQPSHLEIFDGAATFHSIRWLLQLSTARRSDGKPIVDITGLEILSLEMGEDSLHDMDNLFKHFTHLTKFRLFNCGQLLLSRGFPDLFLPSLKTLQHVQLHFIVDGEGDPFLPLVSKFASIADNNIIESINISMFFDFDINYTCGDEWGALDRVFTQSESGWKNLKSFSLCIGIGCDLDELMNSHIDELIRELQKLPGTQLRGLASSEGIMFRFSVSCEG